MFNQTENMIARAEYQQMQQAGHSKLEGVEMAAQPSLARRLFNALFRERSRKTSQKPSQAMPLRPELTAQQ